jgi:hypothetical protein
MFSMTMGSVVAFTFCILLLVCCALSGQANHVDRRGFPAKKEAFEDRESSENSGLELMDNFQDLEGSELLDDPYLLKNGI